MNLLEEIFAHARDSYYWYAKSVSEWEVLLPQLESLPDDIANFYPNLERNQDIILSEMQEKLREIIFSNKFESIFINRLKIAKKHSDKKKGQDARKTVEDEVLILTTKIIQDVFPLYIKLERSLGRSDSQEKIYYLSLLNKYSDLASTAQTQLDRYKSANEEIRQRYNEELNEAIKKRDEQWNEIVAEGNKKWQETLKSWQDAYHQSQEALTAAQQTILRYQGVGPALHDEIKRDLRMLKAFYQEQKDDISSISNGVHINKPLYLLQQVIQFFDKNPLFDEQEGDQNFAKGAFGSYSRAKSTLRQHPNIEMAHTIITQFTSEVDRFFALLEEIKKIMERNPVDSGLKKYLKRLERYCLPQGRYTQLIENTLNQL